MADVFISYSQKDRETARGLAGFLAKNGVEVWWDHELLGGESYRGRIKEELAKAKAAIVIWSPDSVESSWVVEEADEAREGRKLVATRTEGFDVRAIPLGFRSLQTEPVTASDRILKALARLGVSTAPPPEPPKPAPSEPRGDAPDTADKIALEHWEYVKESRNPAEFEKFIREFPTSKLAPLAQLQLGRLATEAWQNLLGSESIPALESFVAQFPGDTRAADAKRRLEVLRARTEEAQSWARIRNSADIEAVRAHVARFPGGANAAAARARMQVLERERDAEENWRATAGATEPGPFEQFLATYPDSVHVEQARQRLEEIHRAREEADWRAVRNERHPAPFLRFLKAHPKGQHAPEALQSIAALPRLVEQEAWAEVKDSELAVALQGYLTAFPDSRNAKAARARLRTRSAGHAPASAATTATSANADAPVAKPKQWKRDVFWLVTALMLLIAMGFTGLIFGQMSYSYGASNVSGGCAVAAIFLTFAAILLRVAGPRLYPAADGQQHKRELLFHAIGAIGILGWMSIVQAVAEAAAPYGPSVQRGLSALDPALALAVAIAVTGILKAKTWQWPRFAYYALLLGIGSYGVVNYLRYYSGGIARAYWVTTGVEVCGGAALLFLTGAALLREFGAWRHRQNVARKAAAS
jgi:TolA-binding protein